MASGTAFETSGIHVLQPDQFEGEVFDQEDVDRIQASYYKGAPPQWVNFYLAERSGTPFVKRDGYENMKRFIDKHKWKRKTVTKVNLLHQPGSGGSTLAMQVLWDLRRAFQCAKVEDIVTDANTIAKDVIDLARMPNIKQNKGKPVLLLLDNANKLKENFVRTLEKRLIDKLNDVEGLPVIILNCVRKVEFTAIRSYFNNTVLLKTKLQTKERGKFDEHHMSVTKQFESEHNMFHGFNMIRGVFSSEYTADLCNVIVPPKTETRDQLFAILALVNTYAPGSDFLLDQCERFLQNRKHSTNGPPMFEEEMRRFSDLLVTYTNFEKNTDYVRIAHPIATECVQLFKDHGLSMGRVTSQFLRNFCKNIESPMLYLQAMQTTKSMLTMREMQDEKKETFPKLIQHIYDREGKHKCRTLLMEASQIFPKCATFPQALARCYFLMVNQKWPINEIINAEKWANEAIKRHPNNSFIMDTLGQVHKHHLFHYVRSGENQSEVLRLGLLAINAFQEEEMAAEKEEAEKSEDGATPNISPIFNTRGKSGYLHVADTLFESLPKINSDWRDVLTCSRMIQDSLAVQLTRQSRNLTINLRAEVKKRFEFFEKYLTYSQPDSMKDDPGNIRKWANDCYAKYVETPPRVLKMMYEDEEEMKEDVIVTLTDLQEFLSEDDNRNPEFYHLALLQLAEDQDLGNMVMKMRESYDNIYEKYFRSRYLVPLYMKSMKDWQTLSELSLKPWEIEKGTLNDAKDTENEAGPDQRNTEGRLLHLVRVPGRIQRPKVLAFLKNTVIEVEPHNKENVLENGVISFYLGFNIKGPVAFNIKYEKH